MSVQPDRQQVVHHASKKSAKRNHDEKGCLLRSDTRIHSTHPTFCGQDGGCSSHNALSVAANALSVASPGNPEYAEDLSRLCRSIQSCPIVMRDVDRKRPLAVLIGKMLLQRLARHAHDLVLPVDLLTALVSLARSEGDFATIAALVADAPGLSDSFDPVLFPLGPYAQRQFLLSLIRDQSCLLTTRHAAGELLLEEPDSHRSRVATLALAIHDTVAEASIRSGTNTERLPSEIDDSVGDVSTVWTVAFPVEHMDQTTVAALQATAGDLSKPAELLDFLLKVARLSMVPSAAAWLSGLLADMDKDAAEPIVDAMAMASVHIPLDEKVHPLDAGFVRRHLCFDAGNGPWSMLSEKLLLSSVYQPELAAPALFPVTRSVHVGAAVADSYCQLLLRHSDYVDPAWHSLAVDANELVLPPSGAKGSAKSALLHTILASLRAEQLVRHNRDMRGTLSELDRCTATSDPALNLQVANARALLSCMDLAERPHKIPEEVVDSTALEMSSVIVRNMVPHSNFGHCALPRAASVAVELLRMDVLIRDAFDSGDWALVTETAYSSHGLTRLLAQYGLSLSAEACVPRQCATDFKHSDSLDEKLGHLTCLGLCPSDYALDELRFVATTMSDPFASLARAFILHAASQYRLSRVARRRLYSKAYCRFIASAFPGIQ